MTEADDTSNQSYCMYDSRHREAELLQEVHMLKAKLRRSANRISKFRILVTSLRRRLRVRATSLQSYRCSDCRRTALDCINTADSRSYTEKQKNLATSVYYNGRAAVTTMRRHLRIPSDRTTQQLQPSVPGTPGITDECIGTMKQETAT